MSLEPPAAPKELDIGFLSREYEPLRELGRGGMGWVVAARHRIARHEVAIKVSAPGAVPGGDALARLQREARVLSTFRHPNIVRLYDLVDVGRGRFAIVMELVRGTSLAEVLKERGALPFDRCRSVLTDVMAALAHAHERGVVHRDVKPANVLLNRDSWAAKLCDFGIARGAPGDVLVTAPEIISGTPAYMSPEQIDGKELDRRTDVYSVGLLAWEMLSGQAPWRGLALFDVLYRQKHAQLTAIETLRPETPASLALAVEGALAKDRELRWRSIEEMREQLDADEPTARLLQLRDDRFTRELERRDRERTPDAGARASGKAVRDRVIVAGDPSVVAPPEKAPPPVEGELASTVQMPLERILKARPPVAVPDLVAPPVAHLIDTAEAPRVRAANPPPAEPIAATVPVPRIFLPERATVPAPQATAERSSGPMAPAPPPREARRGDVDARAHSAPATPTPVAEASVPSPRAEVVAEESSPVEVAPGTPPDEHPPAEGEVPGVLHAHRDRRTRGTIAGAFALLTALLLIWAIRSSTDESTAGSEEPSAAAPPAVLSGAELPALLPGVPDEPAETPVQSAGAPRSSPAAALANADSTGVDSVARVLQELSTARSARNPTLSLDRSIRAALFFERTRRMNEATRILDEGIEIFPREGKLYALRARVRVSTGQLREAWTDIELARRTGAQWDVLAVEAEAVRLQHGSVEARAQLEDEVRAALAPDHELDALEAIALARALAVAGDDRTAMGVLARIRKADLSAAHLLDDPYLRPLASDPRFQQIRQRLSGH